MARRPRSESDQPDIVSQTDIEDYFKAINAANALGRSTRRQALLEHLVRTELSGNGENLKAYSIGLDVFDKPDDFDPTTDSSVRVEIGRLRERIALFEASDQATTAICVEIPLGSYRPRITRRERASADEGSFERDRTASAAPRSKRWVLWPALIAALAIFGLVVEQLVNHSDLLSDHPSDDDYFPIVLVVEPFTGGDLADEISSLVKGSFKNSSIVKLASTRATRPREGHFALQGAILQLSDTPRFSTELIDLTNDRIVWTRSFRVEGGARLSAEIDSNLNGELSTRLIGAAKRLLEAYDPVELTPQQLFVLGTWVSGPAEATLKWESERVDLMKIALEKDPDFGPAHSVLADKYGFLANVYPTWDTPESLRLSRFHAERAAELSPLDPNVLFNVAQSYWHAGRHRESQLMFTRVTELDSGNILARFFSKVVPYWCADVPDDMMTWAVDFDAALSPDDPIRWIVLTWISSMHTNRGEYELALDAITKAAKIFQVGYTYMAHAMLLNKAGWPDAAAAIIRRQREHWPLIGAERYGSSTIPRLCLEQPNPEKFIADYAELTEAVEPLLEPPQ